MELLAHAVAALRRVEFLVENLTDAHSSTRGRQEYGGTTEVSRITGRAAAWVRAHGEQLGGWKSKPGRGGRWNFRLADVEQHARDLGTATPPTSPARRPEPHVDGGPHGLTPRPRM